MARKTTAAYDHFIRLLIVGDDCAGKTDLLFRFTDDADGYQISTIGADFKIRTVEIDNKRCKLQVWDIPGQERFRPIVIPYFRDAMGILIVYDITNEQSFANVRNWYASITLHEHGSDFRGALLRVEFVLGLISRIVHFSYPAVFSCI
jgi:Ras-related protein Rab-8A